MTTYRGSYRIVRLDLILPAPPSYEAREGNWRRNALVVLKYNAPRWNDRLKKQLAQGVIDLCADWGLPMSMPEAMQIVNEKSKGYTGMSYLEMNEYSNGVYTNTTAYTFQDRYWNNYNSVRTSNHRNLILEAE